MPSSLYQSFTSAKQSASFNTVNSQASEGLPDFNPTTLGTEPLALAHTIPSSWYTHPGFHTLEEEAIFTQTWQLVGHVSQLKSVGDFFLATVANNPIILLRENEFDLKAFYNVCKHRGGPLAKENGHATSLKCAYHGWTYGLDGTLKGVPEFEGVECFDKQAFALKPIHLTVWEGLIFVNLADAPTPFMTYFEGIRERIQPIDLSTLQFHSRVVYNVACNWKVYVDNYLEGYHLNSVHPELMDTLDYKQYTTEISGQYSLQYSPIRAKDNVYGTGEGEIFYYMIFPNLMLNIMPNRLQTNLVVPVSHDQTLVYFDYFYTDITSEKAKALIQKDLDVSELVQQQDIEICEFVQKGLASKAYDQGRFSVKREAGVHHFQNLLKQAYQEVI
jgi:choline monooxygenase